MFPPISISSLPWRGALLTRVTTPRSNLSTWMNSGHPTWSQPSMAFPWLQGLAQDDPIKRNRNLLPGCPGQTLPLPLVVDKITCGMVSLWSQWVCVCVGSSLSIQHWSKVKRRKGGGPWWHSWLGSHQPWPPSGRTSKLHEPETSYNIVKGSLNWGLCYWQLKASSTDKRVLVPK